MIIKWIQTLIVITDLLLIRHGEAYNTAPMDGLREVRDRANPPLTPLGECQAEEVQLELVHFAPQIIVVSPFMRAVQTIWPFVSRSSPPALEVRLDARIGEIIHGGHVFAEFKGMDLADYKNRFEPKIAVDARIADREIFPAYPEDEDNVRMRVRNMWEELDGARTDISRMVVVGHGASLSALLTFLIPDIAPHVGHVNGGVSHLQREHSKHSVWRALYINQTRHLAKYGNPAALADAPMEDRVT